MNMDRYTEIKFKCVVTCIVIVILSFTCNDAYATEESYAEEEPDAVTKRDYILLFGNNDGNEKNLTCNSLIVSGYKYISFPTVYDGNIVSQCHCVVSGILVMAINDIKRSYCRTYDTCSELPWPYPPVEQRDFHLYVGEKLRLEDPEGNDFHYVDPNSKKVTIVPYRSDDKVNIRCTTYIPSPEPTPASNQTTIPNSETTAHTHSISSQIGILIIALVVSVTINTTIVIITVFLYHKFKVNKVSKKMESRYEQSEQSIGDSGIITTMQYGLTDEGQGTDEMDIDVPVISNQTYTPLGIMNSTNVPSRNGRPENSSGESSETTYGTSYTSYSNNPGTSKGNVRNATSMGDIHSKKQLHPLPKIPERQISITNEAATNGGNFGRQGSHNYDYIEYETDVQVPIKRETSHKYLQIT